ncbi:MAG: hypothetical protein IKC28_01785 [Clostridia bacterium]|nr:hypothetical protein [Clostridia bacterium]
MKKLRLRISPFMLLMLAFLVLLALGILIIVLGMQPPRITYSLPYTV